MNNLIYQRINESEDGPQNAETGYDERTSTRVVPWITLWSDERVDPNSVWLTNVGGRVSYSDEDRSDWFMGVLWHREGIGMTGQPMWSQVHARRQRRAMVDPRCQVCGERLSKVDIPWLLPSTEYEGYLQNTGGRHPMRTTTAPTCVDCQSIATRRCPRLNVHGSVRLVVGSATPVGVTGDIYAPKLSTPRRMVAFDDHLLRYMVAKQLVVRLDNARVIE